MTFAYNLAFVAMAEGQSSVGDDAPTTTDDAADRNDVAWRGYHDAFHLLLARQGSDALAVLGLLLQRYPTHPSAPMAAQVMQLLEGGKETKTEASENAEPGGEPAVAGPWRTYHEVFLALAQGLDPMDARARLRELAARWPDSAAAKRSRLLAAPSMPGPRPTAAEPLPRLEIMIAPRPPQDGGSKKVAPITKMTFPILVSADGSLGIGSAIGVPPKPPTTSDFGFSTDESSSNSDKGIAAIDLSLTVKTAVAGRVFFSTRYGIHWYGSVYLDGIHHYLDSDTQVGVAMGHVSQIPAFTSTGDDESTEYAQTRLPFTSNWVALSGLRVFHWPHASPVLFVPVGLRYQRGILGVLRLPSGQKTYLDHESWIKFRALIRATPFDGPRWGLDVELGGGGSWLDLGFGRAMYLEYVPRLAETGAESARLARFGQVSVGLRFQFRALM